MNQEQQITNAHSKEISCLIEAKGQIWSSSYDSFIHIWTIHV